MAERTVVAWMEIVPTLRRSLTAVGSAAAALGLASAAYQAWGSARDRRRFPPPGRMVDVGGRRIHLWIEGEGSPPVVIVPALGTSSIDFAALLPQLSDETTVAIFDRAGLGWSEAARGAAGFLRAHEDLHAALHRSGIAPPYILVGHSIGGYIVRLFAADYPREVAGIVMIDPSHHDQMQRFHHYRAKTLWYTLQDRVRLYGLDRLAVDLGFADRAEQQAVRRYPPQWSQAGVALSLNDRDRRATLVEMVLWGRLAALAGRTSSLGDIPLTVVSSSEKSSNYVTSKQIAARRADYKIWLPMQQELAGLSTDSKHVIAENAGHYVHRFQPDLVIEAILDVVRRCR